MSLIRSWHNYKTKASAIKHARSCGCDYFIVFKDKHVNVGTYLWSFAYEDEKHFISLLEFKSIFPLISTYFIFDINKQRELFPKRLASIRPMTTMGLTEQQTLMKGIRENGKGQR